MDIQAKAIPLQIHTPNRAQYSQALQRHHLHLLPAIKNMKEERKKREDMLRKPTISELAPILPLVDSLKGAANSNQFKLKLPRMADIHLSQNNNQRTVHRNMEPSQVRQLLEHRRQSMETNPNMVAV